jgi:hypothetical protein
MPLLKKSSQTAAEVVAASLQAQGQSVQTMTQTSDASAPKRIGGTRKAGDKVEAPMTKDDYWRRREERDVQRDKDMAWSGLAQAALDSIGLVQLNTSNTLEGFVELIVKATDLLLQARDKKNS